MIWLLAGLIVGLKLARLRRSIALAIVGISVVLQRRARTLHHDALCGERVFTEMANLFCNVWVVAVTIWMSHDGVELKRTREGAEPLLGLIPSP